MTLARLAGVALLAGGLAGCAPDLQALASDPAAVCVKVTSIWTTVTIDRNWGCEMPAPKVAAP